MLQDTLKRLRRERNLTQAQLAERLNLSQATIGSWESGVRRPDIDMLPVIADFYGVTVDTLLGTEKKEERIISMEPWNPEDVFAVMQDDSIRLMARGMARMTPENRQKILDVARTLFAQDFDEEGNRKNDPGL